MARLTGGRTALLWREHHCMADGMSGLRLLAALLWDTEEDPSGAEPAPHAPTPAYTGRLDTAETATQPDTRSSGSVATRRCAGSLPASKAAQVGTAVSKLASPVSRPA